MKKVIVISLDFQSTEQGLPLVILGHMALAKIKCTPIVIHFSNSIPPIYITASDQSMVESGVTEGGKNTASFLFRE